MLDVLACFVQRLCPQCNVDLALVNSLLKTRDLCKGEYLFHEGDLCDFVGVTIEGCLRSFFLKDDKELTLFFHPERHTLGDYESLRRQRPACFTCQAIEDSKVLIINRQVVEAIEREPDGYQLLRLMAEDLAFQLRDRLLSLYRDTPEDRYRHFLDHEPQLLGRIPQYYLASHLGIEPESLSRLKRRINQKEES